MDRLLEILERGGVEPENRARVGKIVETLRRVADCKRFDVVNVVESPDLVVKLFGPMAQISARTSLSALARECRGVKEATVVFPRSGLDAPLEICVSVLKEGRRALDRYSSPPDEKIYLEERLREVAGGDVRMPRLLLIALKAVATSVISYSKPELKMSLTYASGATRCMVTFAGMRECSLSFLEYLFEHCGRRLVDVELRSEALDRLLIATLDTEVELAEFPHRKEERALVETNKRARLAGSDNLSER